MKTKLFIAITTSLILAAPLSNAEQKLAMLDTQKSSIGYAETANESGIDFTKSKPKRSLRDYLASARAKDTQEDFKEMLSKKHPANYKMLQTLPVAEQQEIFSTYKQGERIKNIRKLVITYYAGHQQR